MGQRLIINATRRTIIIMKNIMHLLLMGMKERKLYHFHCYITLYFSYLYLIIIFTITFLLSSAFGAASRRPRGTTKCFGRPKSKLQMLLSTGIFLRISFVIIKAFVMRYQFCNEILIDKEDKLQIMQDKIIKSNKNFIMRKINR